MTDPILVTGATGFIGAAVARALVQAGERVRVLVRQDSNQTNIADLEVETVTGDLTDPVSLRQALQGCRQLYHVAAHYSLWEPDPSIFYRVNVDGTATLMEAALELGVSKVVYTSSVATLKIVNGRPSTEADVASVTDMVGHYKRSKFLAEERVYQTYQRGLPVVIVNPSAPVGPGDVKPTPTGQIILDYLNGRMSGYINTGLNLVDVADVAAGHLLAAQQGRPGERYILGNQNMTLLEIFKILAKLTNIPAPRFRVPYILAYTAGVASQLKARVTGTRPRIPLDGVRMARKMMFFDSTKARRELGYAPADVESALARAVEWFRKHGYVHS